MKTINITCDECGESFALQLKTELLKVKEEFITRYYLKCPKCGEEYTTFYENDKCRELKEKITRYQQMKIDKKTIGEYIEENKTEMQRITDVMNGVD